MKGQFMYSDKKTSFVVKLMLYPMVLMAVVFVIVALLDNKKTERVAKHHVTMAKVVEKREVASRVVRDVGATSDSKSNGPVTVGLNLSGISFDLKNSR